MLPNKWLCEISAAHALTMGVSGLLWLIDRAAFIRGPICKTSVIDQYIPPPCHNRSKGSKGGNAGHSAIRADSRAAGRCASKGRPPARRCAALCLTPAYRTPSKLSVGILCQVARTSNLSRSLTTSHVAALTAFSYAPPRVGGRDKMAAGAVAVSEGGWSGACCLRHS